MKTIIRKGAKISGLSFDTQDVVEAIAARNNPAEQKRQWFVVDVARPLISPAGALNFDSGTVR
jgi:hypothetical protein